MRLDLSKIPMDITFKNDGEKTKMLLNRLIYKYVDNGETITITANSSEEAAIISTRLKELGISTNDDGGDGGEDVDTLPDRIYRYNDITISFKDVIDPNIYNNYETLIVDYMTIGAQLTEFQKEHEEAGDLDDPDVQAEFNRLHELFDRKYDELVQTYGYYIGNNDVNTGLFDTSMQYIGVISVNQLDNSKIYTTPKIAKLIPVIAEAEAGPDFIVDISKVTKPGWYAWNLDTQSVSIEPCDTPTNILIQTANINHIEEIPYLEKSIYNGIFKNVETENEIKEYIFDVVGLGDYTQDYTLSISADTTYNYRLGFDNKFRLSIPITYTGNINITIVLDKGETIETYNNTLTLNEFEDYQYELDVSGHM